MVKGRPKKDKEWNGINGLTDKEVEILKLLENWDFKLEKAGPKNIGKKANITPQYTYNILYRLMEKGTVKKTKMGTYITILTTLEEEKINKIILGINDKLYNRIVDIMDTDSVKDNRDHTVQGIIIDLIKKGIEKRREDIEKRIESKS